MSIINLDAHSTMFDHGIYNLIHYIRINHESCRNENSVKFFLSSVYIAFIHSISHITPMYRNLVESDPVMMVANSMDHYRKSIRELLLQVLHCAEIWGCTKCWKYKYACLQNNDFQEGRQFILQTISITVTC
jgi:hypothetical protein